jgi:preprotein translocase subunit SecY
VFFTLGLLAVYRVGHVITIPGVSLAALEAFADQLSRNSVFGLYDMFSGGNLSKVTIFALGIMPYISASIILQLLTVVWPYLEKLSKEGELGRRKITQYTRYGTILLSVVQGLGIAIFLEKNSAPGGFHLVLNPGFGFRFMTVLTLTTGTCFIMWLGEQITERGVGNGMSLIIYAGIVVGMPRAVLQTFEQMRTGQIGLIRILILMVLMALVVAAIVFVERGHRRVTVQYAKRVVGRRMYGGSSTHIPLKVNTGGVIPVIFASSILAFPATIAQAIPGKVSEAITTQLGFGMPLYNLLYVAGIVFFTYFYTAIIFNPDDVAENMRKYGGFVPGIRPGKRTAEYIDTILTRITLAGAIYLALIALLPNFLISGFRVQPIPFIGDWLDAALPKFITEGMNVTFFFGGTSLLIVVGVAMDTVQQVESQLIMRHYDGFMKKSRVRGRRA